MSELDYAKLTVGQIKDMLVAEERFTQEEIDAAEIKGKSAWVDLHKGDDTTEEPDTTSYEWTELQDELDGLVAQAEEKIALNMNVEIDDPDTTSNRPIIPSYDSPEWNEYVMDQFAPEELIDGKYPNVNALRRLVGLLLGDIVFSGPVRVEQTMEAEHTGKAVVTYRVTIDWKLDQYYATAGIDLDKGYPQRTFTSVASSWVGNTDDMFAVFPESIAETRAEGRTLRRALRINVVCADELTKKDTAAIVQQQKSSVATTGEWEEESPITDQQTNTIQLMCDRLGIGVMKFINSGKKSYSDISKVTRTAAAGMLKQLNRYQSSGGDAIDIPQDLIGD